ncbi:hypothetical protein [Synechococcus sp. PCC 7336]|uniref:hypothetical protein n=1 Tax=Synechococcus sp. PCC 7336 TaxID=195250 RepID=UPI00034D8C45|nr:hypothetical protein [Synechococcus sp. PCC 7336]
MDVRNKMGDRKVGGHWGWGLAIVSLGSMSANASELPTVEGGEQLGIWAQVPAERPAGALAGDRADSLSNTGTAADLQTSTQLLQPTPFFGTLDAADIVAPLQLDSLVPFPEFADLLEATENFIFADFRTNNFSPLERPPYRLFGFETGSTLQQNELVLRAGLKVFDDCEDRDRSCDLHFGADYGALDTVQLSFDIATHEDIEFPDLVGAGSELGLTYESVSAQVKWQAYANDFISFAPVVGVEFGLGRDVAFSPGGTSSRVEAEARAPFASVALPASLQLGDLARFHFNPQVSFFPETLAASGDLADLQDVGIGLDGDRLDYFGTVVGFGVGLDIALNSFLKVAADYTVIVSGENSADNGDDSLFVARPVFHAGVRWTPNSRTALDIFLTNRFGPTTAAPSNLLVQPDNETIVGVEFSYLPDFGQNYPLENRNRYPEPSVYLANATGLPSATLPIDSVLYEVVGGTPGRVAPTVRYGLLDDLEIAANFSSNGTDQFEQQGSLFFRYALLPDRGENPLEGTRGITAALTAGLEDFFGDPAIGVYGEIPITLPLFNDRVDIVVTPQTSLPVQAGSGDSAAFDTVAGVEAGLAWRVAKSTQLFGSGTAIVQGDNQLESGSARGSFASFDGRAILYSVGVRQLFPTANTLYALDLFFTNSAGEYGLQGLTALPDGDTRVGARVSILNGLPTRTSPPREDLERSAVPSEFEVEPDSTEGDRQQEIEPDFENSEDNGAFQTNISPEPSTHAEVKDGHFK